MSNIPVNLKYTESHEWIRREADGTLTIGITDHAQEALGDLVFIELPQPGKIVGKGDACVVLESVKAASDAYAPVSGEVIAANQAVADSPESLNKEPYEAWLFKMRSNDSIDGFLDAAGYQASIGA